MASWVLVPCARSRVGEVERLLCTLMADAETTVVVTTLPDPVQHRDVEWLAEHLITFERPGMFFGAWFNFGLDYIARQEGNQPHEVCCVGSSHSGATRTVEMLTTALRKHELAMVGPDLCFGLEPGVVLTLQGERTHGKRIPPECFMVPNEQGLRFDAAFRWWYSDDDFEMQARQRGSVGLVGGTGFRQAGNHPLTAETGQYAFEDRGKFMTKWGSEWLAHE